MGPIQQIPSASAVQGGFGFGFGFAEMGPMHVIPVSPPQNGAAWALGAAASSINTTKATSATAAPMVFLRTSIVFPSLARCADYPSVGRGDQQTLTGRSQTR
jgi:hypothetical protein